MATYVKDTRTGYQVKLDDTAGLISTAITAHEAASNPHPTYLTQAEGDAAYSALGHNHDADYADIAHTHALDDLSDVTITTPSTDEVLKYNGSAWVNGTAAGASALDDLTDVTITTPSSSQVLTYNGSAWVNSTPSTGLSASTIIDESGSSTTNFTSFSGSWSSSSGIISQTTTSDAEYVLRYTTAVGAARPWEIKVDVRFPTGGSVNSRAGVLIGFNGSALTGSARVCLYWNSGSGVCESVSSLVAVRTSASTTLARDTWYTVKVVGLGAAIDIYVDDVFKGHTPAVYTAHNTNNYIGLYAYAGTTNYRNFTYRTLSI